MMADFTSAYQQALKIVRDFLENAKEFTKENEERLKLISEIAGILESMTDEESTAERSTNQCTEIIRELCVTVLFGIYIECTTKVADRSSMVNEIEGRQKEDKSSKLSETMQIKFDEVKHFLQKAKGRLEKIDDLLSEMVPKVRVCFLMHFSFC